MTPRSPTVPPPSGTLPHWRWRALSPVSWIRALVTVYAVGTTMPWQWVCPHCATPLLTWRAPAVTAGGRCATCRERLGPRPWLLETAIVAIVAVLAASGLPASGLPAYLWFGCAGVAAAVIDATVHRMPNAVTAWWTAGTVIGLSVPAVLEHRGDDWTRAVLAGVVLAAALGCLALVPSALGGGDVKAAAAVGTALGWISWPAVYTGMLIAFLLAFGYAVLLLARRQGRRGTKMAFGPCMVAGALLTIVLLGSGG